ncbi:MAG: alcohol dehydrogenase catalytic domain-containing protein [Candidatus Dormibacteraeota bacterium]|nr:alcohol dehydrogenase catalytic domain-containing protein [Candidatus Dormibacteraeota bacterium]
MRASSLCGSDLRAIYRPAQQGIGPEAYRGVIAGHEPCGDIVEVGPNVRGLAAVLFRIAGAKSPRFRLRGGGPGPCVARV